MARYRVLQGIDYPPNKRAEIGAIVSDLPKESISWLLASGVIANTTSDDKSTPAIEEPVVEEIIDEELVEEVSDAL